MKLHLLRHAKTDQFSKSGKDFDRKLLPKGINQAIELGIYFEKIHFNPSLIKCSSAVRTRETISMIQKGHVFESKINYLDDLYLSEKDQLLSLLWDENHSSDIFIIGHNNGLSDLASYLLDEFIDLKTGEYICIEFNCESWKETSKGLGILKDRFRSDR